MSHSISSEAQCVGFLDQLKSTHVGVRGLAIMNHECDEKSAGFRS